jgi:hypothetical protein
MMVARQRESRPRKVYASSNKRGLSGSRACSVADAHITQTRCGQGCDCHARREPALVGEALDVEELCGVRCEVWDWEYHGRAAGVGECVLSW